MMMAMYLLICYSGAKGEKGVPGGTGATGAAYSDQNPPCDGPVG